MSFWGRSALLKGNSKSSCRQKEDQYFLTFCCKVVVFCLNWLKDIKTSNHRQQSCCFFFTYIFCESSCAPSGCISDWTVSHISRSDTASHQCESFYASRGARHAQNICRNTDRWSLSWTLTSSPSSSSLCCTSYDTDRNPAARGWTDPAETHRSCCRAQPVWCPERIQEDTSRSSALNLNNLSCCLLSEFVWSVSTAHCPFHTRPAGQAVLWPHHLLPPQVHISPAPQAWIGSSGPYQCAPFQARSSHHQRHSDYLWKGNKHRKQCIVV